MSGRDDQVKNLFGTQDEFVRFAAASNHPYSCDCPICLEWWDQVGPEIDDQETGTHAKGCKCRTCRPR